jgi:hypothetical protein
LTIRFATRNYPFKIPITDYKGLCTVHKILLTSIFICSFPVSAFASEEIARCWVNTNNPSDPNLNIRASPGGEKLAEYPGGTEISVQSYKEDARGRLWAKTDDGYVLNKYLECEESSAEIPAQTPENTNQQRSSSWHDTACMRDIAQFARSHLKICESDDSNIVCREYTRGVANQEYQASSFSLWFLKKRMGETLICLGAKRILAEGSPSSGYFTEVPLGDSLQTSFSYNTDTGRGGCYFEASRTGEWEEQARLQCSGN